MLFLCLELDLLILTPEDKILYHNLFLRKYKYNVIEIVPSSLFIKYTIKHFKSKMLSPTGEFTWRQKQFAFETLYNNFYIEWQWEKFKYILLIFCMLHHCQRITWSIYLLWAKLSSFAYCLSETCSARNRRRTNFDFG